MRLTGHGHALVRATHTKTLEFTPDPEITARATCVLAVGVDAGPAAPLAGPVRITITVGTESFPLQARANPTWDPRGPMVVRRSALRLPGTLATHADAAASDLPRALVAALQAGAAVEIDVEAEASPDPVMVLFAADPSRPHDPALAAELAVADTVLADDAEALRLIGRHEARPGGRTLIVATRDLPGRTATTLLEAAEQIETVGLTGRLAAAAASPSRGAVTFAPADADVRTVLHRTPATHRLVLTTTPDRLPALLALAVEHRGGSDGVLVQEHAPPVRIRDGAGPDLPSQDAVHLCLDARADDIALDPAVRAAIAGLVADGVPTKTVARALAVLTGWPRRRAYEFLLDESG